MSAAEGFTYTISTSAKWQLGCNGLPLEEKYKPIYKNLKENKSSFLVGYVSIWPLLWGHLRDIDAQQMKSSFPCVPGTCERNGAQCLKNPSTISGHGMGLWQK